MTILGFSLMLGPAEMSPALAEHMVALVRGDGWDVPLRYFLSVARAGHRLVRRPGMLRPKVLAAELTAALLSEHTAIVRMRTSARGSDAGCRLETDAQLWSSSRAPRLHASGERALGAEATQGRWLDAVLAFADRAPAIMGAIYGVTDSQDHSREADVLTGYAPGSPEHPRYSQWLRLSNHQVETGDRYVRFPRWGTIYSHRHIGVIGGIAAIRDAVAPAVIRELSAGVYVQLTDSLATIRSAETTEKERAFEALVAPLLPPVPPVAA